MAKRKQSKKGKKRRQWLYVIIVAGVLTAGYISYQLIQIYFAYRNEFVRYDGFNIDVPLGYTIHGIDISHHQGDIVWTAVKSMRVNDITLDFAYIKATEGLNKMDANFTRNWKKCRELQIRRGAYHFYLPDKSGAAQAINFMNVVKLKPGDLPPVLDIEKMYRTQPEALRVELQLWLTMIETHYGVKPIIYTNIDFYNRYLGKDFNTYPLWIAHYAKRRQPRIDRDWMFWQFNENGTVNGISRHTDFNVFNGDTIMFNNLLVK